MNTQEEMIRQLESPEGQTLKAQVYGRLNGAIERLNASEQVWLVALSDELAPLEHVCCYCGDELVSQTATRRILAGMLRAQTRSFAVVFAFEKESANCDVAAMTVAMQLQRVAASIGVHLVEQFLVTGRGESAWWRSATGID